MLLRRIGWLAVAVAGSAGWGVLALHRGETISAAWLVLAAVGTYLIAYRFYSRFLADRVLGPIGVRRRTATVTMSAPDAAWARAISWKLRYLPVPTIRRERKARPAITSSSAMVSSNGF